MPGISIGDLSQSFLFQRRGVALRTEMARLNEELTSGRVSDVGTVLSGNMSYLSGIERDMETLSGYKVSTTEAEHFTSSLQSSLDRVQEVTQNFGADLIAVATTSVDTSAQQLGSAAHERLETIFSALNTAVGGRSLMSGTASDTSPLASPSDMLAALSAEISGVVGVGAKIAAVKDWFADPAGFDTVVYQGSDTAASPFQLSESEKVALDVRANDDALKDMISSIAIAALSSDDTLGITADERKEMLLTAGETLFADQEGLTALRADVGLVEARIDEVATRNAVEETSLEYAKGALLGVDPYEAATKLEEVQFQLESLYAVTIKSSELSLVNFL